MTLRNVYKTLSEIHQAGVKFLSPQTLEKTYEIIVHEAIHLVHGDDGRILIKKGRKIKTVYTSSRAIFNPVRKNGYTNKCFVENKAFVVQADQLTTIHPEVIDEGFKSAVFIPLAYHKKVIAVLIIRSCKKRVFSPKELGTLKLFGATASLALRKTQLYTETKEALEARDLFINLAGHELRTPLTSIKIYAELMQRNLSTDNKKLHQWSQQLRMDINRLTNLINEFLQVQKVKEGKLTYTMSTLDIHNIVQVALTNTHATFPTHEFVLKNSIMPNEAKIVGDFEKLVQVFINICSNAAKFSSPKFPIEISVSSSSEIVSVTISDKGKGISRKDVSKIFDKFYRGEKNFQEGMGLGLYLTKIILDKHKGKITVSSQLCKGTTVKISFPKKYAA